MTLKERIQAAAEAFRRCSPKAGQISFGVEVKRCSSCQIKKTDICRSCDKAIALKEILKQPCCHDCARRLDCAIKPDWGQPVRINCPCWKGEEKEVNPVED